MKKATTRLIRYTASMILFSLFLTSCNKFGDEVKIKKSSVYYKNVTEAEAKKVGDYLYKIGYFSDENDISVQITKPKDSLQLRFVVDKEKVKPEFDEQYLMIVTDMSDSIFNKAPIVVFLSDTDMKDIKRVGVTVPTTASNGEAQTNGDVDALLRSTEAAAASLGSNVKEVKGNKLYYDNNIEPNRVNALVSYLTDGGYFQENSGHIAVILKKDNGYVFKEAFIDDQINSKETTAALEEVATSIKQALFNSEKFTFEVCNLKFEPQLSFIPGAK